MRPRRASDEEGPRENSIWRGAKFAALFLLSFGVAFRLYASVEVPSSGPTVRQRSLREADATPDVSRGASSALGVDQAGSSALAAGSRSRRCKKIFGSCKRVTPHRPYGIDTGEMTYRALLIFASYAELLRLLA